MTEFISNLIPNNYISTIVMSLFPLIELKGGIVFARGVGFDFFMAFLLAYVGSTIVFFPIYFLLRPILNLLKKIKWFNKFACKVEGYFQKKADQTLENRKKKGKTSKLSDTLLKQIGVFIFVAIPLPMTGIWTGTAIAVFLGLKFRHAILPAVLGNFVAGAIISLLAELCLLWGSIAILDYILYGLFALAFILLAVVILKIVLHKPTEVAEQGQIESTNDEKEEEDK